MQRRCKFNGGIRSLLSWMVRLGRDLKQSRRGAARMANTEANRAYSESAKLRGTAVKARCSCRGCQHGVHKMI